jgi:flagellar hook-length control protein FliK
MEGKAGQGGVQAAGIPGPDIPAKAGRPATEARAPEASQPPPAPLDLSSLLPQAPAAAGHERRALAVASGPAPDAAPQGAAGGQPTPVHVVPIEIGLRAMAGLRQFDIRLDPDELGRVDVALSISEKGEVSARLVVDRVETLHLLQRDARTLERAFEQAGLKPSDGGIDISLRDPSGQPGFRQNREQDEAPQRSRPADGIEPTEEASLSIDPVPQRRLIRLGGVDLSI